MAQTANNAGPIRSIKYRRPPLYPEQQQGIFCAERYAIVEASTKAGKTVGCLAWLIEQACLRGGPDRIFRWIAPTYNVARIAFRRACRGIPEKWRTVNITRQEVTLRNGSIIQFMGGEKPDLIYGEDVWACVVDEASRCKEDVWAAVRSTLTATRGPCRLIGNVKGRKNWAYRLARAAESGRDDWRYAKITAEDAARAGVLDWAELTDAQATLPKAIYDELYLCIPNEDGGNPFGMTYLTGCVGPMSKLEPVVWGWDFARSHDWTVGVGLDKYRRVCRFHRWQAPWPETIRRVREATMDTPAAIDATGAGDVVKDYVQRARASEIPPKAEPEKHPVATLFDGGRLDEVEHEPVVVDMKTARELSTLLQVSNFEGYVFTAKSKQYLMEGLAVVIQGYEITIPEGQDTAGAMSSNDPAHILNELEAFEYEYTRTGVRYSAPEGLHDDCVCALALASWKFEHRPPEMIAT